MGTTVSDRHPRYEARFLLLLWTVSPFVPCIAYPNCAQVPHLANTNTILVYTPTNMSDHHYKFNVTMTCGGCSGAIERVLKKLDGIKDYNVSLDTQTADITTADSVSYETVL